ncbi:MAG: glycosyl hydrolase, partial [Pirellulaceae bacterium]|nr:glycosyl hydrolase [Pirellulaceae bacterium]
MIRQHRFNVLGALPRILGAAITVIVFWASPAHSQAPTSSATSSSARPWMDKNRSPEERTELVLNEMTIDEKITLVHGVVVHKPLNRRPREQANYLWGGAGYIPGIPRLGIPDVQMTNGRSGVGQAGGLGRYATALPSALALSASWDLELSREYGQLLGKECRQLGFQVSLGGTANLIREACNGRNFECLG